MHKQNNTDICKQKYNLTFVVMFFSYLQNILVSLELYASEYLYTQIFYQNIHTMCNINVSNTKVVNKCSDAIM